MEIGDKVAYVKFDVSNIPSKVVCDFGYIFFIKDGMVGVSRYQNSPEYINTNKKTEKCFEVDFDTKQKMIELIQKEIDILKSQLRNLTFDEKQKLKAKEFKRIKNSITLKAKCMCKTECDDEYIEYLKLICRLKKELFAIDISKLDNIRMTNGIIRGQIRTLNELLRKIEILDLERD